MVRHSDSGDTERFGGDPSPILWNRGGVLYSVENRSRDSAELLLIELEDSLSFVQLRVPYSERDPIQTDAAHFRVILENAHVRVLLLRLDPRERTEEVQFASHLEVALSDLQSNEEVAGASLKEVAQIRGEIAWKENQLKSILNAGGSPLRKVIVELKHPFCYRIEEREDWKISMLIGSGMWITFETRLESGGTRTCRDPFARAIRGWWRCNSCWRATEPLQRTACPLWPFSEALLRSGKRSGPFATREHSRLCRLISTSHPCR